jgi:HEAT repeat protein
MRKLLLCVLALAIVAVTSSPGAELSELVAKLRDKDSDVRRAAAKELGELGPEAKGAVADLRKSLADSDLFVRRYSAEALGAIGPDARSAIPDLKKAIGDSRKEVQLAAVVALGKIGGSDALSALLVAIRDHAIDAEARRRAAEALGSMGKDGHDAVKPLIAALKNDPMPKGKAGKKMGNPDDIRLAVVTALGQIANANDKDAISAVQGLTDKKQKNKELKKAAKDAVRAIENRTE